MLWKRSSASNCLERNCLIRVVSQSSLLRLHVVGERNDTSRGRWWMLICSTLLIGRSTTLHLLCVNISWHRIFRSAPLIAKTTQRGRIWGIWPLRSWKDKTLHWQSSATPRESSPLLWCGNQRSGSWLHLQKIANVYKIDVRMSSFSNLFSTFSVASWLDILLNFAMGAACMHGTAPCTTPLSLRSACLPLGD